MIRKLTTWMSCLLLLLVFGACQQAPTQETEAPAAEAAAAESEDHGEVQWGYEGAGAPENWGDLSPEFAACKDGMEQSPIDVSTADATVAELPPITFDYQTGPLTMVNNGHALQVNFAKGSSIEVDGTRYDLLQAHFHAQSENTVDGQHTPLEIHFVHADADGNLAVVGVMIEEGDATPGYDAVFANLPATAGEPQVVDGATVDPASMLPAGRTTYRFAGSLTTPPCSEGVSWLLMTDTITASADQIAAHNAIYPDNRRPVQPLNARTVSTDKG